ncbi:unnamed protein product [Rotaria sordida]|uniref:Uncharacterized protein n=1 Tax=Rotaria sordida TaxID=392033 RepID=A0A814LJS7_9BILA|nr:unnamed protein product [Rotaria sordida]
MSSDNEVHDEDNFQCEHIITESHKKAIYSISICQQALSDESEEAFLFATCAINQICVYKYTIIDEKSSVQLIQSYCDSDDKEYFYDCKWTMFGNTTILAAAGLRGVVRVINIAHQCHLKPLRHLGSVNQIAFASEQPTLMASSCSNYAVYLWDAEAALCLANYVGPDQHKQGVLSVDINYNGTFIVSGGLDNIVCVWSTQDKEIIENMAIAKRGPLFKEFRLSAPHHVYFPIFYSNTLHEHYVDSVKWFSEDIIVSKSADHVYCIWKFNVEQKDPNILFRWNRSEKSNIIFDVRLGLSVTRKLMAIGRLDGSIFIWNMTTLPDQPNILTHRESKSMDNFEIFIDKTNNDKDQNIEYLTSFGNKSYEISLFQIRHITIQVDSNDFYHNKHNNSNVVGFKIQINSTNPKIINLRKEVPISTETIKINNSNTILVEDLYILSRKKSLGHIFNAYPSPTLIYLKQNSTNDSNIHMTWSMKGNAMGLTKLIFHLDIFYDDDTSLSRSWSLNILVIQPKRLIDKLFYTIIPFIVIIISILMGFLLDLKIITDLLKNPKPVIIGFLAQYGLMPFLAMGIAKIFHYTPLYSLALFVIGCCPGSGASNQWTVLFDGDVNLSAIMSFVSTAASFFMMPLYFYTIGRFYMDELSIRIPFLSLVRSLALVVIPYSIGIVISYFYPKTRPFIKKLIKPIMIFVLLFFLTFGLIVNWYLFIMIDLYTALTAPLLPFLGFLFGGILAWIFRMNWTHIKTIGIEAGIQNVGIAFIIIMYSFPQPYATQGMIVPMIVSFFTTKPFWIILIIRNQIRKYKQRKEEKKNLNTNGEIIHDNDKLQSNNEENLKQEDIIEIIK